MEKQIVKFSAQYSQGKLYVKKEVANIEDIKGSSRKYYIIEKNSEHSIPRIINIDKIDIIEHLCNSTIHVFFFHIYTTLENQEIARLIMTKTIEEIIRQTKIDLERMITQVSQEPLLKL